MSQKYKARGIILKGSSIKENDRLVTILTPEYGLIRAVAPGAKKHKSSLRGRTQLFVINDLLIIRGKSLDKLIQADTVYTYPGLSKDLGKLASAQYLAELALSLAVDEQPQPELYELLNEHLRRIESCDRNESIYPYLSQAVFHLTAIAGLSPQVFNCYLTQTEIEPNMTTFAWEVGFSFEGGGILDLQAFQAARAKDRTNRDEDLEARYNNRLPKINYRLGGLELDLLQQLNRNGLPSLENYSDTDLEIAWIRVERILREYIQYHTGKTIRSANLVDNLYVEF
ncbi:DNA repair protein RecO [Waterburya agarophytonicola K14]|uniref:DNA repair protein RecO n=1 Tax=Waterburya agarophytonicola KI4 TaxID=2874699 RepID=A0A964BQZ9_9CYAN|nr:DNA repair protein RecO [Waterburya agarophytonicola]MCC0177276.1 DNA repair protein RecO [Waterburya agarophytonicola KI4]